MLTRGFKLPDYASSLGMLAYSSCSVATPACLVIISREMNLSFSQGGLIEVIRSALILFVLLLSGFVAAHFGKPVALSMGSATMGVGLLLYAIAPGYASILAAMGLAGFGGGILEGLMNPFVHETHPEGSGRYLNIVNGFWSVGVLTASITVGQILIMGLSWRWVMGGLGVFSLIVSVVFAICAMVGPAHERREGVRETFGHLNGILRLPAFWLFGGAMFFAAGAEGAFTFWVSTYLQVGHGTDARLGGIGIALFAGGMMIGRFASGHLVRQENLSRLIIASCIAGFFVSLVISFLGGLLALYLAFFAVGLCVACLWPSIQSFAADRLPVDSSMLFILLSCGGIPGFALVAWFIGIVSDYAGIRTAFWFVPLTFVLCAALVHVATRQEQMVASAAEATARSE